MAVLLDVEEIAIGDFSEEYGTVKAAEDLGGTIHLEFINGTDLVVTKGTEMMIDQGGRFDHGGYRRPFLN
jgi:hypothetical protein